MDQRTRLGRIFSYLSFHFISFHFHFLSVLFCSSIWEEYHKTKMRKNADAAAAARWQYRPMIISAYGRAHSDARKIVHRLSAAAGRRFGGHSATRIECAWWRNCGTLLMERACSMVTRCMPHGVLPHTLGGVADDRVDLRHEVRIGDADARGVVAGADGPATPVGD